MKVSKKVCGGVVMAAFLFQVGIIFAETKKAEDIFGDWFAESSPTYQHIFRDKDLSGMTVLLNAHYWELFKKRFNLYFPLVRLFDEFWITQGLHPSLMRSKVDENMFSEEAKKSLGQIYALIQNDIPQFIELLKKSGLENEKLNEAEEQADFTEVITQNRLVTDLLFSQDNETDLQAYLFAVSNHFFEYCFDDKTWEQFKKLLDCKKDFPIARFLFSNIWYFLAGQGWKDWHEQTLKALKKSYNRGGTVVYIAGGVDIYQLLYHGIYRIKIIDPQLPSQKTYYSEGWSWLIKGDGVDGGIGDEIILQGGEKALLLRRDAYHANGFFTAKLSTGSRESLQKSTTRWLVFDAQSAEKLGSVVFERRFCRQQDFICGQRDNLLMSFNELYFITTKDPGDSWGIDVKKIPKASTLFVKQLRHVVNAKMLCHIREADIAKFQFIKLGSAIN